MNSDALDDREKAQLENRTGLEMNTYGVKYFTLSHGLASPRLGLLMCLPADKNVDSAQ